MLAFDSLVTDLIFSAGDGPDPERFLEALGGEDAVKELKMLDPDMQDPRFEMELSPSRPFRRRGERRLMIIDDSVAPMRESPQTDPVIPLDLRPAKERLIGLCEALSDSVRMGRLFALGSWGEAVMVARSAVDFRAWALQTWALDPMTDIRGHRRAQPLSEAEFEEKLMAFERRLEELSESHIISLLGSATLERRGEWLVLSVLEDDGTWDLRDSALLEQALVAVEEFSMIPGAPKDGPAPEPEPEPAPAAAPAKAAPAGPPLKLLRENGRPVFLFPSERFDLEVAATLGKRDWQSILTSADADGKTRDQVFEHGAGFVAPLEFLSEVFVDGKPLSKPTFEAESKAVAGARTLPVHMPRFGPALLIVLGSGQRFITSEVDSGELLAGLLA